MDCHIIKIPNKASGVYLLKREGVVIYVGQSKNVINRFSGHSKKYFNEIEIIWCAKVAARKLEKRLIRKHKPLYNKQLINPPKRRNPHFEHFCNRCNWSWISGRKTAIRCAKCKSCYWNQERKNKLKKGINNYV